MNSVPSTKRAMRTAAATLIGLALAACADADVPAAKGGCATLETRDPNAVGQVPAFAGQTRACGVDSDVAFDVVVAREGARAAVGGRAACPTAISLVTEKAGRLRIVSAKGELGEPVAGLPAVDARGQGGLLDVALSPSFAIGPDDLLELQRAARGRQRDQRRARRAVGRQARARAGARDLPRPARLRRHQALRLAARSSGRDGMLYVTLGERSDAPMRPQAQRSTATWARSCASTPDGAAPRDNPFVGQSGALPEIWSLGHRNVQAAAFDPQGRLWDVEHGPRGGDELNLVDKGKNYGWPLITYGEEYSGTPIAGGATAKAGLEQPVYYWDPVIAPSGAQFYTGDAFPAWRGSLFVGAPPGDAARAAHDRGRPRDGRGASARRPRQAHPRRAPGTGRRAVRRDGRRQRRALEDRAALEGGGAGARGSAALGFPAARARGPSRMKRGRRRGGRGGGKARARAECARW